MPIPMLHSLARRAGVSRLDAERMWKQAKSSAKAQGKGDNYGYIVNIVKKMMKLSVTDSIEERLIGHHVEGTAEDYEVRCFFDSGNLCFASVDDVLIEAGVDPRIDFIVSTVNNTDWPADHEVWTECENYKGSLQTLLDKVLRMVNQ